MANELKAGVVLNFASTALRLGTSFLLTPYILSCLGKEEYGTYTLVASVLMWFVLADFGISGAVSRYVAEYRAKGDQESEANFLGNIMFLNVISGFMVFLVSAVVYFNLSLIFPKLGMESLERFKMMYLISCSYTVLYFPFKVFSAIPNAYQKFIVPGLCNIATALFTVIATVLFLAWGYKAIALTIINVVFGVVGLLFGVYYSFKFLKIKIKWKVKKDVLNMIFKYSSWLFIGGLVELMYWRSGNMIIGHTSGPEEVTVFSIGINFAHYFMMASTAVSSVFFPKIVAMTSLKKSNEDLTTLMIRVGRLQLVFIGFLVCFVAFLGKAFLALWVGKTIGEEVSKCWFISLLVVVPLCLPLVQNLGIQIVQAKNLHKGRAILLFVVASFNIVIGYFLSKQYDSVGLAIGTSLSLIFGQGIGMNIFYTKVVGLNIWRFFKEVGNKLLFPFFLLAVAGSGCIYLAGMETWFSFFTVSSFYAFLYLSVIWFIYMNESEKILIGDSFNRVKEKFLFKM